MEFNADSSKAGTLESYHISSDVYIAKLFDIVSLYNHIGAELFARNVRYHIRDALNVESQIQNTLSWYKPVNFAVSISEVYRLVEKQYRNATPPGANTLAVLANGRYFFVAYVVNALNHAGKPLTAERSFANFDYSADHVKCAKEYIIELILQYSTLVAQFAETYLKNDGSGRNTLNSNDFKIPAFYQAWCDNTQGNDQISNWLNSLMAALGGTDEKVSEPA